MSKFNPTLRRGSAGVAYVQLQPGIVHRTIQVTDEVLLDANPSGQAIGVEFLNFAHAQKDFPQFELGQWLSQNKVTQVKDLVTPGA